VCTLTRACVRVRVCTRDPADDMAAFATEYASVLDPDFLAASLDAVARNQAWLAGPAAQMCDWLAGTGGAGGEGGAAAGTGENSAAGGGGEPTAEAAASPVGEEVGGDGDEGAPADRGAPGDEDDDEDYTGDEEDEDEEYDDDEDEDEDFPDPAYGEGYGGYGEGYYEEYSGYYESASTGSYKR
jgi:hypothetical protein